MSLAQELPRLSKDWDVVVVGGGIVGLATAYKLKKRVPALKLLVLEKENDLGQHQTSHNSGVIHSGIYYKPNSQKAITCRSGYDQLIEFCWQHEISYEICGKIIVATDESELDGLKEIRSRGEANGLKNLRDLNKDQLRELEPHCAGIAGLHVPQTGIIEFKKVAKALAKQIQSLGGLIETQCEALEISRTTERVEVITVNGTAATKLLINCGGLHSDRIAGLAETQPQVRIIPFRGEYYILNPKRSHLVKNLIYPVPNPEFPFLGVHMTRMMKGSIEIGPNAVLALQREGYNKTDLSLRDTYDILTWPGFHKIVGKYWKDGMLELTRSVFKFAFLKSAQKLIPELNWDDLEYGGAGVRAQACDRSGKLLDDFLIEGNDRMIHVLNAPSPAATSSLAIGDSIADRALRQLGLH